MDLKSLLPAVEAPLHEFAIHLVQAIAILSIGGLLAWVIGPLIGWLARRREPRRELMLLRQLAALAVVFVSIAAAFAVLGAGPVLGVLGATALSLGTIGDVYQGFCLMFLRPMRIGDHVEIDAADGGGYLMQTSLTTFTLLKFDSREQLVYPNRRLADQRLRIRGPESRRVVDIDVTLPASSPLAASPAALRAAADEALPSGEERACDVQLRKIERDQAVYRVSLALRADDRDGDSAFMLALAARLGEGAFSVARA